MKIYDSVEQLVGNTPLLELKRIEKKERLGARLFAKLERFNPAGSVKDRAAKWMIEDAERRGLLKPGSVIIEPTSGNTGIGLAAIGGARGYRVLIVMPDSMSRERIVTMKAYGAELVLTPGSEGMAGAVKKAEELKEQIPGSIIAGQFSNPANAMAHFDSTAPEIFEALDGRIDCFVAGVGTGGTVTGAGRFFKSKDPAIKIIAVEPASSPLLSEGRTGPHDLQGIGANFVPELLDMSLVDEVIAVTDEQGYECGRMLGRVEGILAGISSGAALFAALQLARRAEYNDKNIALLLPDLGERYLSGNMFNI